MTRDKFSTVWVVQLMLFASAMFILVAPAFAQQETILYSFANNGTDGYQPSSGVVFDAAGNLYGTTRLGGPVKNGIVFQLTPNSTGSWNENVLHIFRHTDGHDSFGGVILDAAGNLYGATNSGGVYNHGAVFKLKAGSWAEQVLHNFNADGDGPQSGLISDRSGNLFGTTYSGGAYGFGVVYELTPTATGWSTKIVHSFGRGTDGAYPADSLIIDAAGNLYGTTENGGAYNQGTVFELTPTTTGWTEKVLHSFNDHTADGYQPYAPLVLDAAGNLYGTTSVGGTIGYGTVFELTPKAGGGWTELVLHNFDYYDGYSPEAGLIFDAHGNLYGTTVYGGANGGGIVFELEPAAGGGWTENIVHNFNVTGTDGTWPRGRIILDASGNIYGTTFAGGAHGQGTVFEITP